VTQSKKRPTLVGKVEKISDSSTVNVRVSNRRIHPTYKKVVVVSKKYLVHNSKLTLAVGDEVKIQSTRPISKRKNWVVLEKLEGK
tara:strand:- start:273 stop:527 length:255 start_codon:yes stop_codon:yes gene_type:complete